MNSTGLCECGCGNHAPIAPQSHTKRGWVKGERRGGTGGGGTVTRAEALRALITKPREVPDDGRIGHRVIFAKPDERIRINYVFRVLKSAPRRIA
jgi:hypothetical protein